MEWFRAHLWELKQSTSLKIFGSLLSALHIAIYIQWSQSTSPLSLPAQEKICWWSGPLCELWQRHLTLEVIQPLLAVYAVFSVMALISFLSSRLLLIAWLSLFFAVLIDIAFYFSDIRLVDNGHLIHLYFSVLFLFFLQKKRLLQFAIIAVFLYTGFLKLNTDWLAGYWLSAKMDFMSAKGVEWVAALSALIEITLPVLLFTRFTDRFMTVLFTFGTYVIFMQSLQGYFNTAVYLSFLIFLLLLHFEQLRHKREFIYQSYIRPEASFAWIPLGIAFLAALQTAPYAFEKKWGQQGFANIVKHEAPITCQSDYFVKTTSGWSLHSTPPQKNTGAFSCLPNYFHQSLKVACKNDLAREVVGVLHSFKLSSPKDISSKTFQLTCGEDKGA